MNATATHPRPGMTPYAGFDYVWHSVRYMGERKGQACKIVPIAKVTMTDAVVVEFEDGARYLTTRFTIRRTAR